MVPIDGKLALLFSFFKFFFLIFSSSRFDILKFEKFPEGENPPPLPYEEQHLSRLDYFWEGEEWEEFVCDSCFIDGEKTMEKVWEDYQKRKGRMMEEGSRKKRKIRK